MARLTQISFIISCLLGSWLAMQMVHECGHVMGAWISGAQVTRVVINPLTISRTDLGLNPHPLFVVWAGPLLGTALPLIGWLVAVSFKLSWSYIHRFFADFCCIANGLYIGVGSFQAIGDCGEMLRHGSSVWQLWLFGSVATPIGFYLWHRQGMHFGLGPSAAAITGRQAFISCLVCLALLVIGFVIDGK